MKLSIGEKAPGFELEDTEGRIVRLSELVAERAVVLVFNRGLA